LENFADLSSAGLLGILVPKEHGGVGADFLTYTRALEQLAIGDAATALAFNMHNIVIGSLTDSRLDRLEDLEGRRGEAIKGFRDWLFREVVRGGKLFATAASEPGVGFRLSKIRTIYRRVEGGFVINGVKSFVSMGSQADYCIVAARSERDFGDIPGISYLVVERGNPGVRVVEDWDTLGMRSTCSNTLHFNDCFVPANRLYLLEAVALYKCTRETHWLVGSYNGVYLGIASAVFAFVKQYLSGRTQAGTEIPLVDDALVQYRVGKMWTALEAARAVTYEAAARVAEAPGSPEANVSIHRAKYMVGELAPWIASEAIQLCGGSTMFKSCPLERYYRDARCGGVMPAKSEDCLTYVGKAVLGLDVMSPKSSYW
jgi:alkylation response protein AidB-like acyl-CoA dehydrogenase